MSNPNLLCPRKQKTSMQIELKSNAISNAVCNKVYTREYTKNGITSLQQLYA